MIVNLLQPAWPGQGLIYLAVVDINLKKKYMKAILTSEIQDNRGGLGQVVMILFFCVCAWAFGRGQPWSSGPYAALSTPFTLLWTVCLRCTQEGRDGNSFCGCQKMCESLSVSLSCLTSARVCVRGCAPLWQTQLDSVGGVNSITFFSSFVFFSFYFFLAAHFWIWFSPSSKASQMDTYWKRCWRAR